MTSPPALPPPSITDRHFVTSALIACSSSGVGGYYIQLTANLEPEHYAAFISTLAGLITLGAVTLRWMSGKLLAPLRAWLAAPGTDPQAAWVAALNYPYVHSIQGAGVSAGLAVALTGAAYALEGLDLAVGTAVGSAMTVLLIGVIMFLVNEELYRPIRTAISTRHPLLPVRGPDIHSLKLRSQMAIVITVVTVVGAVVTGTLAFRGAEFVLAGGGDLAGLARRIVLVTFLGLSLTLAGCLLVVRQAVAPLRQLDRLLQGLTPDHYDRRFAAAGSDEVAQLGQTVNRMLKGLEERERLKDAFGRYVARQVGDQVLKGDLALGGELLAITILMSDIRGFTPLSEKLSPPEIVTLLNRYFTEWVDAVTRHGGFVDKFIGDAIMVVFGAPEHLPPAESARRAAACALDMQGRLETLNARLMSEGLPPIHIGIGIHTGEAVVGNIGSAERMEYTCIGDAVNTTARIESACKEVGADLLISTHVADLLAPHAELGVPQQLDLKGKTDLVGVVPLLGLNGPPS